MMRRTIISLAVGIFLPFSASYADLSEGLASNASTIDILSDALAHCLYEEADVVVNHCTTADIDTLMSNVAALNKNLLDSFVTAGIESGLDPVVLVEAAIKAGANPELIAQTAILAGADPTDVAEATAAGGTPGQGTGATTPGQTGNAVSPPAFGNNTGSGGGGNPSPT
ncbi:hypothetical protein [Neptuniibacter sp. 2_MG-2023]|uniref:hypothetical protein n=1 Tax=Neptuniibacter sp. 2_MG-2023 TaxID=3062671 RepID=UPI0026E40E77|nr:hypothetical protein [Neptuniibacter sp. 2_MG-2023]MDO6512894.1 hypothetical protein [Neptuniibacter sp. 2_MG-2023]